VPIFRESSDIFKKINENFPNMNQKILLEDFKELWVYNMENVPLVDTQIYQDSVIDFE
jgi:hypothetical protein